jgi:hypothetical protein
MAYPQACQVVFPDVKEAHPQNSAHTSLDGCVDYLSSVQVSIIYTRHVKVIAPERSVAAAPLQWNWALLIVAQNSLVMSSKRC